MICACLKTFMTILSIWLEALKKRTGKELVVYSEAFAQQQIWNATMKMIKDRIFKASAGLTTAYIGLFGVTLITVTSTLRYCYKILDLHHTLFIFNPLYFKEHFNN